MAGFLRKKASSNAKVQQQQQQQQAPRTQPRPTEPPKAPAQSFPPLYARFATSSQNTAAEGPANTSNKVVSGPMALGSNVRRDGVDNARPAAYSRHDVNEPQNPPPPPAPRAKAAEQPKPAVRQSWYTPAPTPDTPATPRSQPHSHSHHHHSNHHHHNHRHHTSTKHDTRTSPEPANHRSPNHATHHDHSRHEKPLPIPVKTPPSSRPPSRQARTNNVELTAAPATARDPPHSSQSLHSSSQKPAYHRQTLIASSDNDYPPSSLRNGLPRTSVLPHGHANETNHRSVVVARNELGDHRIEASPISQRTNTMVPSSNLTSQLRSTLPPNSVQEVSSPKAPVAIVPNTPNARLSHRTSMQAELVQSSPRGQEYNNTPPQSQVPLSSPHSSNFPLPSEPPSTPPMAIGKFKSVFRSDRKSPQPSPVARSAPEEAYRISSPPAKEPLPKTTIPVHPMKPSSAQVSQAHTQGVSGTHYDVPRVTSNSALRNVHQQHQEPLPQMQTVSPPLSPKLDQQQPPMPGKPLIFAAMHYVEHDPRPSVVATRAMSSNLKKTPTEAGTAYPSPPMEFSPSPLNRSHPLPSQKLYASFQSADLDLHPRAPPPAAATPPPTPPKPVHNAPLTLTTSPQRPEARLTKSPSPPLSNLPTVRGSPDKLADPSSTSRSNSPANHRSPFHHVRTLSKSAISVRSQVTSQMSVNSSSTNLSSNGQQANAVSRSRSGTPVVSSRLLPPTDSNGSDEGNTDSLLLDDDPFARIEGVKMLKPSSNESATKTHRRTLSKSDSASSGHGHEKRTRTVSKPPSPEPVSQANSQDGAHQSHDETTASTPVTPQKYHEARSKRRGEGLERMPPPLMADIPLRKDRTATPFPLELFIVEPNLLSGLLTYLTFAQWTALTTLSKHIRGVLLDGPDLREVTLECYLSIVGYERWRYEGPDPLPLSIKDLNDYMRGVSIPTHDYARISSLYIQTRASRGAPGYETIQEQARSLSACTRAYTRVVLRLRAQAEAESKLQSSRLPRPPPPAFYNHTGFASPARSTVSVSSRAPSPSSMSHSHASIAHGSSVGHLGTSGTSSTFRSPLYRTRRAPLLRVFVPSPDEWLSDEGVVDCENELKRAGVMDLMRLGDVVWDVAVGDEGNVGRLVWDGNYLLDLDYTYSTAGDLPKYIHSLAFPPSYFHRVIRTGPSSSNPIAHIDIRPWGEEIAANLQLLQDRIRTETPQGAYHNVVRWVHRSTFTIRPAGRAPSRPSSRAGRSHSSHAPASVNQTARIPIPGTDGLFIDSGWHGTVVVETEGTNEALADLQDRCGPGAFPPRVRSAHERQTLAKDLEDKKLFRVLRERSRPGEIWIRVVSHKERLL